MRKLLWWHVAVVGTAIVLTALLFIESPPNSNLYGGLGAILLLLASWFTLGRLADEKPGIASLALVGLVAISCGMGTGFDPVLATMQCVAYPITWFFAGSMRSALIGNLVMVVAVGVGFLFALGTSSEALIQTGVTCALSLGLSLGLGLWFTRVYDTINERQRLIDQLQDAQAQVAALSRDAGAAGERERLAREIHDTIAQDLAGLVLTAQRGLRELAAGNTTATEKQLHILEENARNALTETRALVASGAAVGVEGGGLATALGRLAARFERETGIIVTVAADETVAIERDSEVVLLRCAQEALANIRKHSSAGSAALSLRAHDGTTDLRISDDGAGFAPEKNSTGFGLTGLRERLALVSGTLDITSSPGCGTTLIARLPMAQASVSVEATT